ncbi:hypothetical protein GCM10023186_45300 [Hymenobacter koreensis]|uniref:Uncharacterized protein n=2 Tax=Hymenobacter koreensis TaxID=1084523 RepID=A0ABP8JP38_9BACT
MLTINTPGGVVEAYDSLHTVPAHRYTAFNVRSLDHSAVGSDMHAATEHLGRLKLFLEGGELEASRTAFNNYLLCLNLEANTGTLLLATVVKSINGVDVAVPPDNDYTGIAAQLHAAGITQAQVEEACAHVRGKFQRRS